MTQSDVTKLIRSIQTLLQSRRAAVEEELVDLASRHEELVQEASERLEKVEQLLHQGLRSEAIELAEQEPNLNEILTVLDFPELGPWNELLESHEIQPVPTISVEAAAELNDAYLATGSIDKLLQHYRTISLGRAPLAVRIQALRRLADRDSQSPVWAADLKDFEKFRLKELRTELEQAVRTENLPVVAALDQELGKSGWSIEVPAPMKLQARKSHEILRKRSALAELEPLSHELSDAYAEFDRVRAKRLQQRFLAVQSIAGIGEGHPIMDVAGPALDWLQEESTKSANDQDHKSALTELETALDRKTTIDELETLYHRATRHGHALPSVLVSRIAERRDGLKSQQKLNRVLMFASACLAGIVAVVAVGFLIRGYQFNSTTKRHDEELTRLLTVANETGQIDAVKSYLDTVRSENPALLQTPELLARTSDFENLSGSESGRQDQLAQLMQSVRTVVATGTKPGDFPPAVTLLGDARKIAKGEEEAADLLLLERDLSSRQSQVQLEVDTAFRNELSAVSDQIEQLPDDRLSEYDAVQSVLGGMVARSDVSQELQQSVRALQSKLQQDRLRVSTNLATASGLQKITDSVGQVTAYEQFLAQFLRDNPGTVRSQQFEAVLKAETPIWRQVGQWNLIRRRLKLADFKSIGSAEAQILVADCEKLQMDSGPFGDELLKSDMLTALRAIAGRNPDGKTTLSSQILAMLNRKTITRAYVVEMDNGDLYYSAKPPVDNGSSVTIDQFTTTTGTQTSMINLNSRDVRFHKVYVEDDKWLSPQTLLFRQIETLLRSDDIQDYETQLTQVVTAIRDADAVDDLLQVLLIDEVLRLGASGSEAVRKRSEKLLEDITATGVSRLTNWVDPEDNRASDERLSASTFLDRDGDRIAKELALLPDEVARLQQSPLPPDLQWVGWMHRHPDGTWVVSLKAGLLVNVDGRQPLCIFHIPAAEQTTVTQELIGELTKTSRISVDVSPRPEVAMEGRPVYRVINDDVITGG